MLEQADRRAAPSTTGTMDRFIFFSSIHAATPKPMRGSKNGELRAGTCRNREFIKPKPRHPHCCEHRGSGAPLTLVARFNGTIYRLRPPPRSPPRSPRLPPSPRPPQLRPPPPPKD